MIIAGGPQPIADDFEGKVTAASRGGRL